MSVLANAWYERLKRTSWIDLHIGGFWLTCVELCLGGLQCITNCWKNMCKRATAAMITSTWFV